MLVESVRGRVVASRRPNTQVKRLELGITLNRVVLPSRSYGAQGRLISAPRAFVGACAGATRVKVRIASQPSQGAHIRRQLTLISLRLPLKLGILSHPAGIESLKLADTLCLARENLGIPRELRSVGSLLGRRQGGSQISLMAFDTVNLAVEPTTTATAGLRSRVNGGLDSCPLLGITRGVG